MVIACVNEVAFLLVKAMRLCESYTVLIWKLNSEMKVNHYSGISGKINVEIEQVSNCYVF